MGPRHERDVTRWLRQGALVLLAWAPLAHAGTSEATLIVHFSRPETGTLSLTGPPSSPAFDVELKAARVRAFPGLPPGPYTLKIAGLEVPLALHPGERVWVEISPNGAQVRMEKEPYGLALDPDAAHALPAGAGLTALLETADAAVIADRVDDGGLTTGQPGLLGAHGASWAETRYRLGGVDVTDPVEGGKSLILLDRGSLGEIAVHESSLPVEWGPGGPTLDLVLPRPGNEFRGHIEGAWSPLGSPSQENPPPLAELRSLSEGRAFVEGALGSIRGRVDGSLARTTQLERGDPTELPGNRSSVNAHVLWSPGTETEVRLLGAVETTLRPFDGRARYTDRAVSEKGLGALVGLFAQRRLPEGGLLSLSGDFVHGSHHPDASVPSEEGDFERLLDGPPTAILGVGEGSSDAWSFAARLETPPLASGTHRLRVGLAYSGARSDASQVGSRALVGELVDGIAARAWDYGFAGTSRRHLWSLGGYAADELRLGSVFLEAGLRFEGSGGEADGAVQGISWSRLLPRVSGRWALAPSLSLFSSYSRYGRALNLSDLAYGDPMAAQGRVFRWNDLNGNGRVDPGEVGALVALVGPGSLDPRTVKIASGLSEPATDEILAGLEARFAKAHLILAGIRRRARSLLETVNVGVPLSDYSVSFVPDPGSDFVGGTTNQELPVYSRNPSSFAADQYVLEALDSHDVFYEAAELSFDWTLPRFTLHLGATGSRAEGASGNRGFRVLENDAGVIGELYDDPNADTFARGRLFFDRAYTVKIAGTYKAPGEWLLGVLARYQDGQPFSRFVIVPDLPQGAEPIMAFPRGLSRFHDVLTFDVRLEKAFSIKKRRFAAVVQGFNVLGTSDEIEEDVVTRPTYRRITAVDPPRVVTFGLSIDF